MIRSLFELDLSYLRHQSAAIARSPARLALWVPYLILLAYVIIWRYLDARHSTGVMSLPGSTSTFATLAGAAYLTAFGVVVARHAGGRIDAFRCMAEAFLCNNTGVTPQAFTIWLQVRKFASSLPRWLGAFVFYVAAFAPNGAPLGGLARVVGASVLGAVALSMLELPAYFAGRRRFGEALVAAGWVVAAVCGVLTLCATAVLLGDERYAPQVLHFVVFDPGRAVSAVIGGEPIALALILAMPLVLAAMIPLLAADALPELYEGTLRAQGAVLVTRDANPRPAGKKLASRIPGGTFALVWKDWATMRRRGSVRTVVIGGCLAAVCGATLAFAIGPGEDRGLMLAMLTLLTLFVALVPVAVSNGLAEDLGKPIWWLAAAPLHARLAAWTISRSWAGAAALAGLPLALGIVLQRPAVALLAFPASLALWWSLHALGLALYATFPSRLDTRGPLALLRLAAAVVFLIPPLWTFANLTVLGENQFFAAITAGAILVLEGFGALHLAVRRIDQNGAMLAKLERAG